MTLCERVSDRCLVSSERGGAWMSVLTGAKSVHRKLLVSL
jgi:hypothetical protein